MEEGQTIQWPNEKEKEGQTMILHIKLNIEQHEPHKIPGMRSGDPEGKEVPSPLVAIVVDLLLKSFKKKSTSTKHNKYVVNQNLEHIDDVSIRELFTII